MSNALAIAAVTSTLRYVLERALGGAQPGPVGGARVTTLRPSDVDTTDGAGGETPKGINVYLYRVTPNHAWNLTDLPTRRADGAVARRPVAALDLHYLLSFHGDDAELDPQRLLGRAVLALAVTPVLTRDVVGLATDAYGTETETAFLVDSDLADQVELVKLSPAALSVDELARLWEGVGTGHLLGLTYTATVVLLEADVAPRTPLPVRRRVLSVAPAARPQLEEVTAPPGAAVVVGTVLDLRGSGLRGPGTRVRIGPAELVPDDPLRPDHLVVTLSGDVPAGVHGLQVLHRTPAAAGGAPPARVVARSRAVPLLMRPTVTVDAVTPATVTLGVAPAVRPRQRVLVTLARLDGAPGDEPATLAFALEPLEAGAAPVSTLDLDRTPIPAGRWLVRLSVDGAESLPTLVGDVYAEPALVLA